MIQVDDAIKSGLDPSSPSATTTGELVLRVRGTNHDGEIIRLRSSRCTIGSGRRCTLRLGSPRIWPVHCLILRGRERTVVRRWSPDTRLNDRVFSDAELSPGDRLGVGPVELEIVECSTFPSLPQSPSIKEGAEYPGTGKITARLTLANRQSWSRARRLVDELRRTRKEVRRLGEQAGEGQHETQRSQAELESRREQLQREAERLEAERAAWEKDRHAWTDVRVEEEESLRQRAARIASREAELAARADELEGRHRRLEAERAMVEEKERHCEAREAQWDGDRHGLDACRAELEVERSKLDASQQDLEAQRFELETTRRELEGRRAALEESSRELAAERAELAGQRESLADERAASTAVAGGRETVDANAAAEMAAELAKQREELRAERTAFDIERRQAQAELERRREDWQQERRQFDEQRDRWAAKHQEIEARLTDWQHELDMREAHLEQEDATRAERHAPTEVESTMTVVGAASTPAETRPAGDAPVNLASVLAKTNTPSRAPQRAGEAETPAAPTETEQPATRSAAEAATASTVTAGRGGEGVARVPAESSDPPAAGEENNEESIDQYMARLMNRLKSMTDTEVPDDRDVRSSEPAAMSRQAFLGADHPYRKNREEGEGQGEEDGETTGPPQPVVRRTRSALESVSSLAAMRELASAAAASAITAHTRNRLRKIIRGKLFLSSVALVLGAGLIVAWFTWGLQTRSLCIGAAGLFLSLLWVVQWAVLSGRLIRTRSGHLSWNTDHAKASKETASGESPASENGTEATLSEGAAPETSEQSAVNAVATASDERR
jgi:hypothetical protein